MTQIISHPSWSTRPALEHAWGEPYLTPELSQTIQQTGSALGMLCLMHRLTSLTRYLFLALVGLLFLQWPLREWVRAYARQANDLGQIVFACYVAIAVTATSVYNKHLAGDHKAGHLRAPTRSAVGAMALCTLPWALFMVWAG